MLLFCIELWINQYVLKSKYLIIIFLLIFKHLFIIYSYIKNLPAPSPNFKSLIDWMNMLLKIIYKESVKINEFEYEAEL